MYSYRDTGFAYVTGTRTGVCLESFQFRRWDAGNTYVARSAIVDAKILILEDRAETRLAVVTLFAPKAGVV